MKRVWTGVAVGMVILLLGGAFLGRWMGTGRRARFPSSFEGGPEGLLAFRLLLEELGCPTQIFTRPWDDLPLDEPRGVLLLASPVQREVDVREAIAIRAWLRSGGAMLIVDDATLGERSVRLDRILETAGLEREFPIVDLDPATLLPARPELDHAAGLGAYPAGDDLVRLKLHEGAGVRPGTESIPLVTGERGEVVVAEGALGSGRVVRILGPLLANDQIAYGDHLKLALRLVESLRGEGPVRFDEYHHGHGGIAPVVRDLDRSVVAWAVLQVLAAAVLYGFARGVRFGPARPAPEPSRRSSLEYVQAMAALYLRARASRHAIEATLNRFAREARSRWSLREAISLEELGREVAVRSGIPSERVLGPLLLARRALGHKAVGEREMLVRVRALARLEVEVLGGD